MKNINKKMSLNIDPNQTLHFADMLSFQNKN